MRSILDQMRKATWIPVSVAITVLTLTACSKDKDGMTDPGGQSYTVQGNASGDKVIPAVSTSGAAVLTGTYHTGTNRFDYEITWTSLSASATAIEFRGPALQTENGGLLLKVDISGGATAGTKGGSALLTEQEETDFLAGKHYFVITTSAQASGEVRGQIFPLIR